MKSLTILLVTILIGLTCLSAGPVEDLIKASGGPEEYPHDNLLVLFDSIHVKVMETGLSYVNTHRLYKVLTTKGAKELSVIKYDYDPLSAFADITRVVIYKRTGEIEDIDMSRLLDYPAPARAIYWGAREKMIGIGHLEPGDALEVFLFRKGFTYALLSAQDDDERYIPPMHGHFYDIVEFWSSNPILLKSYQVDIPKGKPLQYVMYNGEVQSSQVFMDDRSIYTFTKKDITPLDYEQGMVAWSDIAPKLLLSTSPDWKAKSLWFYKVNEDYGSFIPSPDIKAKVKDLLKNAHNEMDSISILTHWVADEIRYSGISMGKGEGYTLHKGSMDFTDRCGVCKDKAGMLITMLRAAGFESYPAMTMAGSKIDYIPADQFNHCVTLVRLSNGKYKLLDPTWVPFIRELWSSAEQQQNYLMGIPEGADLAETPLSPPENHYLRIAGTSEIFRDGTLKGELTLTAEGQSDASIRGLFTRYAPSEWTKLVENELLAIAPMAHISSVNYNDPYNYISSPIKIRIAYTIPDYALVTSEEIIFTPLVASHLFRRGMSHLNFSTDTERREYPFRDRCSRLVELKETITVPKDFVMLYTPSPKSSDGSGASFEGGISQSGKNVELNERIVLKKRVYDPEDWSSFRTAVMAQNQFAQEPVILIRK
jgi:hypothetical protein